MPDRSFDNVTEVSFDRETRTLQVISNGQAVRVDGVDRLYVRSMPWTESDGIVRLSRGHLSINGNVAAVID